MDGQLVSQDDEELKGLLNKFVLVRLVQMGGVDLATFQFDPHVSWSIFFMNGDKTIYGRYGSAHPQAKRSKADSNPNHTLPGLKAAVRKALEVHAGYTKDPQAWSKRLAGKTGPEPLWRYPEKTPSARKYKRMKRIKGGDDTHGCVHCHEVHRTEIDSRFMKKKELPDRLFWIYPDPSIVGLTLSKDHCGRITAVEAGSAAAKAGLKTGDDLTELHAQPILSAADVQWVLHTLPDNGGAVGLVYERDGKRTEASIALARQWRRKGDFCWRYRTFGYAQWLWTGVGLQDDPKGVRVQHHSPGWFKKPNRDARKALERADLIVEVDGTPGWTRSTYMAYLMREKKPGSRVKLKVVRRGKSIDVVFQLPKKRPEVLGH